MFVEGAGGEGREGRSVFCWLEVLSGWYSDRAGFNRVSQSRRALIGFNRRDGRILPGF